MLSESAATKIRLLVTGIALGAALAAWSFWKARSTTTVVLPDGRRVMLRAVTFGKEHRFSDNLLHRVFAPILPANLAARFGVKQLKVQATNDCLVCWVELKEPEPGRTSYAVAVADEARRETRAEKPRAAGALFGDRFVIAHQFSSFPRRRRDLIVRVHVFGPNHQNQVVEFAVENPAFGRHPVWQPEPLPIQRRGRNTEFTLTEFNTGLYSTSGFSSMSGTWTELVVRFDPAADRWKPLWVRISDATGNFYETRNPMGRLATTNSLFASPDWMREQMLVSLPCMLWAEEPAWKLQLRVAPKDPAVFRPEQLWNAERVAIPPPHSTTECKGPRPLRESSLFIISLGSGGVPNGAAPTTTQPVPRLPAENKVTVEVRSEPDATVTLLKVTDDRGSNVLFNPARVSGDSTRFSLRDLAPEAIHLNISLSIHAAETIEFLARPTVLHSNIERERF